MATNDRSMKVVLKNARNEILENKQIYLADSVGCQSQNTFVLVLVSGSLYLCKMFIISCLCLDNLSGCLLLAFCIYFTFYIWLSLPGCLYLAVYAWMSFSPKFGCICLALQIWLSIL